MSHKLNPRLMPLALLLGTSCAATPPQRSGALSAAEHEARARLEDRTAQSWATDVFNDTKGREVQKSHKRAQWHRQMAAALRAAEQRSCSTVPEGERHRSPFADPNDILSVAAYHDTSTANEARAGSPLRGAVLVLRPGPGVTSETLEARLECHRAELAVLGYPEHAMANCPLNVPGSRVTVSKAADGLSVTIIDDDPMAAHQVLERALALGGG